MSCSFGLYVHVPYCVTRCPFCDFNVVAGRTWPEREYTDALVNEIRTAARGEPWGTGTVASVFLGGGTPSLFAGESVARLLDAVREAFPVASDVEITIEANPEAVSPAGLRAFLRAGVNRMSFGIQTFHECLLKRLGRLQTASETRRVVPLAREAGFRNVSLDLLFAIPGGTLDQWRSDLETAVALEPDHVSAYGLTFEEGTPFFEMRREGRLKAQPEEVETRMFLEARSRLADAGLRPYEISNFAHPGFESRHNRNYWHSGPYLGVGAGAHSHVPLDQGCLRWSNERDHREYMDLVRSTGSAVAHRERLDRTQASGEYLFLGLRTSEGVVDEAFGARFGALIEDVHPEVRELRREGLLRHAGGRWALTERGLLVADSVFTELVG